MKTAVLFFTHFADDSTIAKYNKLKMELSGNYDVFWVFQGDNGADSSRLEKENIVPFVFTLEQLNSLDYSPIYERLYGSEHFIAELFCHAHPEYEYYWIMEYDVVFTGNWNTFFDAFHDNDADMLSSHISLRNTDNWDWCWWSTLTFDEENRVEESRWVKSFNPVYRISNRALVFLDRYLKKEDNKGFYEVIISSALYNNGFRLEDFGGTGDFVAEGNRNRFYVQGTGINNGTMRWRPDFSAEEIKALGTRDKLFHPLKRESYE